MRQKIVVNCLTLCMLLAVNSPVAANSQGPTPGKPSVPRGDAVNVAYWGTVTDVTKDSITVQFAEETPKKFSASELLAAGKIPMKPRLIPGLARAYELSPQCMYRLADVKIGDWVLLYYAHLGVLDICDHICIQKRPGGRVPRLPEEAEKLRRRPPFPGEDEDPHIRYDEWINAYWDLEDKGIPYPEKFGPSRRFPVAPLPRPVKVGPAIAP